MAISNAQIRNSYRSVAAANVNNLSKLLDDKMPNIAKIKATIMSLKYQQKKLSDYDELVQKMLEEDAIVHDLAEASNIIAAMEETIARAESVLEDYYTNPGNWKNSIRKKIGRCVTTFSGDPLKWFHFWETFEVTIHKRTDISETQKFIYLLGQLKGSPHKLIQGALVSNSNYEEAVNLLKRSFGDEKFLIQRHLNALFDLEISQTDSKSLMKFRSSYEYHIRALKFYNTNIEDAGFVIAAMLIRKLPKEIWININRATNSSFCTLDEFREAISNEILVLIIKEKTEKWKMTSEHEAKPKPLKNKMLSKTCAARYVASTVKKQKSNKRE